MATVATMHIQQNPSISACNLGDWHFEKFEKTGDVVTK
jgi:hypothetical protein